MQKLKHFLEAAGLHLLFAGFRTMPLDMASWAGGFMARAIGPMMSAHRTAKNNLAMVFPQWPERKRREILRNMWDNLGRSSAELAYLPGDELLGRATVRGAENFPPPGKPAMFFSGHFGNWELTYPLAHRHGLAVTMIYRKANNPYADAIVNKIRAAHATDMIPKGPSGAVKLLRAIKGGQTLAMLIDQKMNDGIAVPFFGRDAMTAPAIAELALRYDMPIIPARVVRIRGCHFEATVFPALQYEKTGDDAKDILAIMTKINTVLEGWIREHPEQWFWVHKRWKN
jgi:KDO2-lipid IV(A) lauroyltransferase